MPHDRSQTPKDAEKRAKELLARHEKAVKALLRNAKAYSNHRQSTLDSITDEKLRQKAAG